MRDQPALALLLLILVTSQSEKDVREFRCVDANVTMDRTFCPETISMSKVNDETCDCCDGSDERSCLNLTEIFQDASVTYSFHCNELIYRTDFHDDVVFGRPNCSGERHTNRTEISMRPLDGVLLRPSILGGTTRSISFWTIFPFQDDVSIFEIFTAVGGTLSKMSSHVSVKRNRVGFLRSNQDFVDLGLDISTLSREWYHLRIVTSLSSTRLYLNDELIHVSQEIQRDAVGTIGSFPSSHNRNNNIASWPSPVRKIEITESRIIKRRSFRLLDHVFVINLPFSVDRYRDMQRVLEENELVSISSRFAAIPGFSIRKSPPLFKLASRLIRLGADGGADGSFDGKGASGKTEPIGRPPKSGSRDEILWWNTVGCFVSHTELWRRLAEKPEGRYLILEDDAKLGKGWRERLVTIFESDLIPDKNWDILYLMNFGLKIDSYPPWRGREVNDHIVKLGPAKDNAKNLRTIAYIVRGGPRMLRMIKSVRCHVRASELHSYGIFHFACIASHTNNTHTLRSNTGSFHWGSES